MKRKESQNPLKTTYQHDESTPFGVFFYDLDSKNMAACGHLLGLVPPLAPTGSSGLICRSPERGCLDCQRFPFPLSSRGWFVLSSMLDAEEQGAQRPEEKPNKREPLAGSHHQTVIIDAGDLHALQRLRRERAFLPDR